MRKHLEAKQFDVEHALNMYASSFAILPAWAIYEEALLKRFSDSINFCHIYIIGLAPKFSLVGVCQDERELVTSFAFLGSRKKLRWSLPPDTSSCTRASVNTSQRADSCVHWRGQIGEKVSVRFLVLGRAPSMQEARRRLSLEGRGTLHVADMGPLDSLAEPDPGVARTVIVDPENLVERDQRLEFWSRWANAKGLSDDPPPAMTEKALSDLTKEPLLSYLLILSGYVGAEWPKAAENRNRIYRSIFEKIWERERTKDTRSHLNDLGREGFDSLMEALGLAAWGGGGRTGDEATFAKMRDVFVRPDILKKAKECGAAELGNVALLFYTRKDEEGGRGYPHIPPPTNRRTRSRRILGRFHHTATQRCRQPRF